MSAKSSRAMWIGATVLVSAVVTASVTTVVLTSGKPTPAVEKPSIVYVPLMLGGTDIPVATAEPVSTTQLTSAELPRARASEPPPAEEPAPEDTPQVGRSLGEALDSLRARYDAATAFAPPPAAATPALTAAPMSTQPAPAVTEEPPPTMTMTQQQEAAQPAQPQVGAGAFTTTPQSPFAASGWQSNPNAGAGQFSTDKGSIDPNIGAGPFTTEWHTPIVRY